MAKQAEQPGCLNLNPADSNILSRPSATICFATCCEPGTISAATSGDFCFPLMCAAAALKSSILELVQLPIKT